MMREQVATRMTAAEYFALPETNQFEELLDGELIVSPPPIPKHQRIVLRSATLIQGLMPDGEVFVSPIAVYLDDLNVPEPDVVWVAANSRCKVTPRRLEGAPDLIVEVLSPATARRDRGAKFALYEKHGVREYWLADPEAEYLEVYILKDGTFERQGIYGPADSFTSVVLGQVVELKLLFGS